MEIFPEIGPRKIFLVPPKFGARSPPMRILDTLRGFLVTYNRNFDQKTTRIGLNALHFLSHCLLFSVFLTVAVSFRTSTYFPSLSLQDCLPQIIYVVSLKKLLLS